MESRELATKRDYQRWIKNARALAEHLRSDEVKGHFDMKHWYEHDDDDDHKHNIKSPTDVLNHCGTSACAWGHAAAMPLFIRQGLKYVQKGKFAADSRWDVNVVPDDEHDGCKNKKKYENEYDYDWAHHLFGAIYNYINMNESNYLFGDGVDRTPKQEARVLDGHASMLEREMNKRCFA